MHRATLVIAATIAIAPAAAHAQSHDVRPSFTQCMDAADGRDGWISGCIDVEATYQDGLLNQSYRRTWARLTPAQRIELRNSQRRWLSDRFIKCERENGDPNSGTMERWTNQHCVLYAIIARTEWLDTYRP